MKIQITPKDFLRLFKIAAGAALSKDVRPILQNVKIVAHKRCGTFLMATDTDIGVRVRVDCDVCKNGAAVLPISLLKILPLWKDETVTIESADGKNGDGYKIVLQADGKRSELKTYSPAEFPDVAGIDGDGGAAIPACALLDAIRRVSPAAAKEQYFSYNNVSFESDGKYLDVVAMDGKCQAWQRTPIDGAAFLCAALAAF